ncbi:unnamed protein product [Ilex paraguariensis]|uniref:Protein kinase domain-containing protein n=1 Tax=Ilex paraguariensis TaxID=185542 RepID=A0ABC8SP42_9AQUA
MGGKRSAVNFFLGFLIICTTRISQADTNPADVAAINNLYVALGSHPLPGWVAVGGDPCAEAWQGVQCDGTDINSITLNGANLGGELGENLISFSSIRSIDLSNNHIGGNIPSNLPVTLQNFFLSDNNFSGSIPSSLSSLNQLSAMSLNNNYLTGEIPDSFQGLTILVNLDLSNNNLSGPLPPSLQNLSSLTTFHVQDNQLSGTLDVLQDLPIRDLNIENNQFSGPIPQQLLNIPNFKKDGNPFNTSNAPSAPPTSPAMLPPPRRAPPFFGAPSEQTPTKPADAPSSTEESNSRRTKKSSATKRIVWISIAAVLSFVILVLGLLLFMPRCCRERQGTDRFSKRHEIAPYIGGRENPLDNESVVQPSNQIVKVPEVAKKPKEEHQMRPREMASIPKPWNEQDLDVQRMKAIPKHKDREKDITPTASPSTKPHVPLTSVKSYTIASLQQYTNSFSQENLIGAGMLGSVYRAQLPNGKFLAVKKLDKRASSQQKDNEFLQLVDNIDKIRHANVVELMGYCAEHGQRLLIYEYCTNGTLQDALHSDDEFKKNLSWNTRVRMALGAARALE